MMVSLAIYAEDLRYELVLELDKNYVISNKEQAHLVIPAQVIPLTLKLRDSRVYYQIGEDAGECLEGQKIGELFFYFLDAVSRVLAPLQRQEFLVGLLPTNDIQISSPAIQFRLEKEGKEWILQQLKGILYLNNIQTKASRLPLQMGDELSVANLKLKVFEDELQVLGAVSVKEEIIEKYQSNYDFYDEYPDYHRSPRIIYRSSEDKVSLNAPEAEIQKPAGELIRLILPPMVMIGVTVLIMLFQPRGLYILATLSMSLMTIIFSITSYFKNRRQYKQNIADRIENYRLYLAKKSMEFMKLQKEQRQGQLYHYPSVTALDQLSQEYNHRIYEKTPLHFDFLHYRLGLGTVPTSYHISYDQKERSKKTDSLEQEGYRLYSRHKKIQDMPIVANLAHGPVGYIGPRSLVIEQLQLLINQIAFFHSYHDVQFITIVPEEEKEEWDWMRWFPHASLQNLNVRGLIYNQRTRDQVLNSLNQILKLRQHQQAEQSKRESTLFTPHYIVLVTDEKLILDHVIMEFFTEDPTNLGCSLIFVEDVLSSLSENVKTVINIKDRNMGQLVLEEGELKEIDFQLDHFPVDYDKERIARRLAPLNHLQNLKSSIPDSVTFMELYQAETVEDLHIASRWKEHAPYKSLAVPLGLRGQGDVVSLNLHEKAHGPHGLIAGTTGSGKSEIIQSYILSLAVNFHPYDVGFLLIDYKGGGMANLFKDLPHLLGTITNLDGVQSMRALVSINAELKRRQRLFAQYDVNHINQYQKKYRLGEATEPMPHLFLISDEFAELKANQPDFMKELVSTARIGRSLGIHLILATQKPTGVVDDQIWSNSRFKIALKVADKSDSNEMLHTPDAAEITQVGRAYLQVGNNEVYELFQSAWSGADYQPEKEGQGIEDHTIYQINALGQYELLNEDLSGLEHIDDIQQVPTELDAIVAELIQEAKREQIIALPQPWLPPLEKHINVQSLRVGNFQELWESNISGSLTAILGVVDVPSQQAQEIACHHFEVDGNLILCSAPGMGKSTFLQTLVMDLARQNTPELIHFYLFDFGTNGLLSLRNLPHTADYFMVEEQEKISKFILRIHEEIVARKKLFSQFAVSNITMYRKITGKPLPQLLIIVDSYDGVKEAVSGEKLEALFQILLRDGSSLGMNMVITASRIGVLKPALQANLKTRMVLKLTEDNESKTIMGRHDYIMENIPGRGLIQYGKPEVFQVALPANGKESFEIIASIQTEAEKMSQMWNGSRPKPIPIVPEKLSLEEFLAKESVQSALKINELPIGLDLLHVENVSLPIYNLKNIVILYESKLHLENVLSHIVTVVNNLSFKGHILVADASDEYNYLNSVADVYLNSKMSEQLFDQMRKELADRKVAPKDVETFVIIPDLSVFLERFSSFAADFKTLYTEGYKYGLHFVIAGTKSIYYKTDTIVQVIKEEVSTAFVAMRMYDQALIKHEEISKELQLQNDEMYLYNNEKYTKIKIITNEYRR